MADADQQRKEGLTNLTSLTKLVKLADYFLEDPNRVREAKVAKSFTVHTDLVSVIDELTEKARKLYRNPRLSQGDVLTISAWAWVKDNADAFDQSHILLEKSLSERKTRRLNEAEKMILDENKLTLKRALSTVRSRLNTARKNPNNVDCSAALTYGKNLLFKAVNKIAAFSKKYDYDEEELQQLRNDAATVYHEACALLTELNEKNEARQRRLGGET